MLDDNKQTGSSEERKTLQDEQRKTKNIHINSTLNTKKIQVNLVSYFKERDKVVKSCEC